MFQITLPRMVENDFSLAVAVRKNPKHDYEAKATKQIINRQILTSFFRNIDKISHLISWSSN